MRTEHPWSRSQQSHMCFCHVQNFGHEPRMQTRACKLFENNHKGHRGRVGALILLNGSYIKQIHDSSQNNTVPETSSENACSAFLLSCDKSDKHKLQRKLKLVLPHKCCSEQSHSWGRVEFGEGGCCHIKVPQETTTKLNERKYTIQTRWQRG